MSYDFIGDIHGQLPELVALLTKLGYSNDAGFWRHPDRQAVFLGDFVDRGIWQREVVDLARNMVESGAALAVMGNHEYNAIAYFTGDGAGSHLRPRTDKNTGQHRAFLDAYESDPVAWKSAIEWFRSLPLWLDLGRVRVVHACWDARLISKILDFQDGSA
jgi:hypothetical protein